MTTGLKGSTIFGLKVARLTSVNGGPSPKPWSCVAQKMEIWKFGNHDLCRGKKMEIWKYGIPKSSGPKLGPDGCPPYYWEERKKERINWPKANSKEWIQFDEDVTNILKLVHSSHENKAETHPGIIFRVGRADLE